MYLALRLHQPIDLARLLMYPIQAMVFERHLVLKDCLSQLVHFWQQSTLKSIKAMVLKGMNWQGFCAPAGDRVD